ncbi:MAG TPA: hypothetical protein VHZ24_00255 [Pirellulales bacterium]|jgi:hypothetical protein|nr:hypothetical protein [Pirellulales bacterium]
MSKTRPSESSTAFDRAIGLLEASCELIKEQPVTDCKESAPPELVRDECREKIRPTAMAIGLGCVALAMAGWNVLEHCYGPFWGVPEGIPLRLRAELAIVSYVPPSFFAGTMMVLALLAYLIGRDRATKGEKQWLWNTLAATFAVLSFLEFPMLRQALAGMLPARLSAANGALILGLLLVACGQFLPAATRSAARCSQVAALIVLTGCFGAETLHQEANLGFASDIDRAELLLEATKALALVVLVWGFLDDLRYCRPTELAKSPEEPTFS